MKSTERDGNPFARSRRIIDVEGRKPAVLRVVGVGGGGCNAVRRMIEQNIRGAEFIAINTDQQVLADHPAPVRLAIGSALTRGLGAGGDPERGWQAADADRDAIAQVLDGADMVFVTAGMGGGTGTGAAPIVAEVAREVGALCVAVVTRPFAFEGRRRHLIAEDGVAALRRACDSLVVISNTQLLSIISEETPLLDAFSQADSVLAAAVQGISEIVTDCGIINVDFEDARTVMQRRGPALFGTAEARGADRAIEAARAAVASPLLDGQTIEGATAALINVTGGRHMTMAEVARAIGFIGDQLDGDANIFFGACVHEEMGDRLRVTVVATGFPDDLAVDVGELEATDADYIPPTPYVATRAERGSEAAPPPPRPVVIDVPATYEGTPYIQHAAAEGEPAQAAATGDAVLPDEATLDQPAFARGRGGRAGAGSAGPRNGPAAVASAVSRADADDILGVDIDTPPFLR